MKPVSARVIGSSPTLWYATIVIDKGSSAGIRRDMPVIAADQDNGGLIGKVTNVTGDAAQVTLITDHTISRLGARRRRPAQQQAAAQPQRVAHGQSCRPRSGGPTTSSCSTRRATTTSARATRSSPSGICSSRLTGVYPPDLPIGTVTSVQDAGTDDQKVNVRPLVNVRRVAVRPGPHQAGQRQQAERMPALTPQLALRLLVLGLMVVLVQVRAVSQITILGTNADLDAARRRIRRAAVRLGDRRDFGFVAGPVRRHGAAADARAQLARLHRLRLRRRPPARAARPAGRRDAADRRRARHRDRDDRLLAHELPARASTPR